VPKLVHDYHVTYLVHQLSIYANWMYGRKGCQTSLDAVTKDLSTPVYLDTCNECNPRIEHSGS